MIRVSLRQGLLGDQIDHVDLEPGSSMTPRQVLEVFRERLPQSLLVDVAVDGQLLTDGGNWDEQLVDGQHVVLLPKTTYGVDIYAAIVSALIYVAVSAAVSYIVYLLTPQPKPPATPQDRGDDTSSVYSWDGIKTNYGPGLPVPWVYGHHAVGGQAIWTAVSTPASLGVPAPITGLYYDVLDVVLSLCEGPVAAIAGITTPVDAVVGSPLLGIKINNNAVGGQQADGVQAWARLGTQDQGTLPAPFAGVSTTYSPGLSGQGQANFTFTLPQQDLQPSQLSLLFTFPSGLWEPNGTGGAVGYPYSISIAWRRAGEAWSVGIVANQFPAPYHWWWFPVGPPGAATARTQPWAFTVVINGSNPGWPGQAFVDGDVEIIVSCGPTGGPLGRVDYVVWRDIGVLSDHAFRYPNEAILALRLPAGQKFSGQRPAIQVPVKGALVRTWDPVNGWSARAWTAATVIGRNPAWCLLDFLLARWGLGRFLTEADIDLPAFTRWAAFCDADPNPSVPWGEAAFQVDLVGDVPRAAWEWVLTFCAAGRAAPIRRNGKISVVYQYRDAHSNAMVSVPAKSVTQLLTSGNCEQVQINWLPRAGRPTILDYQFMNELKGWTQDNLPVEDEDGTLNSPNDPLKDEYVREPVQAYGITRPSQLYREGRWRHRITRLVRREIIGVVGPWALAAEVGDLIDFQSQMFRPYGTSVATAMQVVQGGTSVTEIVIDHTLTGSGLSISARDANGAPNVVGIASYINSGAQCTLTLTAPYSVATGAPCVVGEATKLTQTYQIVSITLTKDLKRRFRAVQWTPTAYDPIAKADYLGAYGTDGAYDDGGMLVDDPDAGLDGPPPAALSLRVVAIGDGTHRLEFARPAARANGPARVYVRENAASLWIQVAVTDESSALLTGLLVGRPYVASVCFEGRTDMVPPELGSQLAFVPEEFAAEQEPNPLSGVRITLVDDETAIEWDDQGEPQIDYVEVRAGSQWVAAPVLARSRAPRVYLDNLPGGVPILVAARSKAGLYGRVTTLAAPGWSPPGRAARLTENDLSPSPAGTHTGTQWNATDQRLELVSGGLFGTYESLAQDLGYVADFYWQVRFDPYEWEDVLVKDMTMTLNSGEARARRVSGRQATAGAPGLDWRVKVSDLTMPVNSLPDTLTSRGYRGVIGSHTQVLVESRFWINGAWTAYRPHVDRIVVASKMQVRVTLGRRSQSYRPQVGHLTYVAYL